LTKPLKLRKASKGKIKVRGTVAAFPNTQDAALEEKILTTHQGCECTHHVFLKMVCLKRSTNTQSVLTQFTKWTTRVCTILTIPLSINVRCILLGKKKAF
jgi:hypothetical protein